MNNPRICSVIISQNDIQAAKDVGPFVDLFEVRIDLIGDGWQEVAKQLRKPWLATNRIASEGGQWQGDEDSRVAELLKSLEMGAQFVDIELCTDNLRHIVSRIKQRAKAIVSYHDWEKMPSLAELEVIVHRELEAGADICKLVGKVNRFEDNITMLELLGRFPSASLITSTIGPLGGISRILSPLIGGYLVYATASEGKESGAGQVPAAYLRKIYDLCARSESVLR